MITIRIETAQDKAAIENVNLKAFNGENEVKLVNEIRESELFVPELSLVAEDNGVVVGHILISEVSVVNATGSYRALALAPMAVLPAYQSRGVGSQLVNAALESAHKTSYPFIVVIGHPWFYPKFGFVPARAKSLDSAYKVPDNVFMVYEIIPDSTQTINGMVEYPPAFQNV